MNAPEWAIGIAVGALIALGRELASIRQSKKDLNGLGARVRFNEEKRVKAVIALLVITESRYDREMIARSLD